MSPILHTVYGILPYQWMLSPVSQAMVLTEDGQSLSFPLKMMMFQTNPFWAGAQRGDDISKRLVDSGHIEST